MSSLALDFDLHELECPHCEKRTRHLWPGLTILLSTAKCEHCGEKFLIVLNKPWLGGGANDPEFQNLRHTDQANRPLAASSSMLVALVMIVPAPITPEFRRPPSSVLSSLSRSDTKTTDQDDSWCTAETLQYFSSAHPRPEVADDSLPPDREIFSWADRCAPEPEPSEKEVDIFPSPDRNP